MSGVTWLLLLAGGALAATWWWLYLLQSRLRAVEELKSEIAQAAIARKKFLARVVNQSLRAWARVL